jgi:phthiocerol/phenolphthiocerol synthesis type-I polyketide synthase E
MHDSAIGIAIIGMTGRFPGARNLDEFWRNLRDGVETISFFSEEELKASGIDPAQLADPAYVRAHGALEGIEWFDAGFFGVNPREAEIMDPQHRLFQECAWEALEGAGYNPETYPGAIGVYAGAGVASYAMLNVLSNPGHRQSVGPLQASIRNRADHLATQVSYKLNLRGPGVTVQTACSTSLVAVHLACQSLLSGECDVTLAGGVTIAVPQKTGYGFQEGGILAPDGHCRAFDAGARGTVPGSGVGVVVLKRLEDALADGDVIHAVIRGSAINNDGFMKVGYTAPGVDGQAEVITEAIAVAGVEPDTIGYIEAHGTGTSLGDPIEIEALTRAFRDGTDAKGFCAIGAVKSNIGHLDTAAGVAGLIKTVLALKHKQIPPSLHYEQPNPAIDFANSPFYVNAQLADWPANGAPRRAGVSSFGLGGTNAHVVLEEAPAPAAALNDPRSGGRAWQLLLLSGRSNAVLETATANLAEYLKPGRIPPAGAGGLFKPNLEESDANLADVAYTLQLGRKAFNHRRAVICREGEAVAALETLDPKLVYTSVQEPRERPVVFMFPGQGAQHVNMGLELYQTEPTFRNEVDRCAELLRPHLGFDLREALYPSLVAQAAELAAAKLKQTSVTQPALFVIEYALARLWMEWGVKPQAMIGHSIGEYVAACLAGVFSLEDALALVAARGRLMQSVPEGAMLSVPLSEKDLLPLLGEGLSLAAVNGPALCVVAGPGADVDPLEQRLTADGVGCRRLHTSHAFHSRMMDPILDAFTAEVRKVALQPPAIPYLSNVSGAWITPEEATDPAYWVRHLRQTVRFAAGVSELVKEPDWILLEVGPGKTLMTIARWYPGRAAGQMVLTSLPAFAGKDAPQDVSGPDAEAAFLLTNLGRLWLSGVPVDWAGYHTHEARRRVALPTYPFERQRYWVEARGGARAATAAAALYKKPNLADWFYVPSWKRSAPLPPAGGTLNGGAWLLFEDEAGLGAAVARRLEAMAQTVIRVRAGEGFSRLADGVYTVAPRRSEDYQALFADLRLPEGGTLNRIVHLWNAAPEADPAQSLDLSFYSLISLAQALGAESRTEPLRMEVVTNNMQEVVGGELAHPERATVVAACRAISQEYEQIVCRSIDLSAASAAELTTGYQVDALLAELCAPPEGGTLNAVAWRGRHRWEQTFEPLHLNGLNGQPDAPLKGGTLNETLNGLAGSLRSEGVYVITGGMGGIGLELAEDLARSVRAKLVLIGRSAFPPAADWDAHLAAHGEQDPISYKIAKLRTIEAFGAEVLLLRADVADPAQMREVLRATRARFGGVNGVIHSAGVAGGGMIQLKTPEMAAGVLAPKVRGTRVLEEVFRDEPLDFLALCSSRSSILGGFGQVDYAAANAFLDAFAHYRNAKNGSAGGPRFTVSINWAGWQEVGMRVDTLAQLGARARESSQAVVEEIGHPLLQRCIEKTAARETYATNFSVATHWVLDDHRIVRQPIIPGTTYLEMVRAALARQANGRTIELRDVYFLSALPVREDETKEVRAVIEKNGDDLEFRVTAKALSTAAGGEVWQDYVMGKARLVEPGPAVRHDLNALIAQCNEQEIIIADDNPIVTYEDLGPRWQSLKRVYLGRNELVALLELPEAFAGDVDTYQLHPALLDRANFTAKVFLAAEGLHLPLGYKGLRIKQALPRRVFAYAKYKPTEDPLFETITFDVSLMDETGLELVAVDEFSQKRVREATETMKSMATHGRTLAGIAGRDARAPGGALNGAAAQAEDAVRHPEGMSPAEGVDAFRRILAHPVAAQVIVSPEDLLATIEQAQRVRESRLTEDIEQLDVARPKHARPNVQTAYVAPRNEVERTLAEIWQETLGIEQVGIEDNFFELGGDSVVGIQMIARFKRAGYQLTPQQLFQNQTITELAASLGAAGDAGGMPTPEQGIVTGAVPLTPSQLGFFAENLPDPHHFNQAMLLDLRGEVDAAALETAVGRLLEHHDALRLRFERTADGGWTQHNAGAGDAAPFTHVNLSHLSPDAQAARMNEVQASLDLGAGPLVRAALCDLGAGRRQLLLVAHYLVCDPVSWWALLADLDAAYRQLRRGETVELPAKTTPYKQWAERLVELAPGAGAQEAAFWSRQQAEGAASLPVDFAAGANLAGSTARVTVALDAEETRVLLQDVPPVYHTVINDVLLAAVGRAFADWTGRDALPITLEDHGRESISDDLDLSRTVGSFRAVYPLVLRAAEPEQNLGEALKATKEQLRSVPRGGLGYGLLRHINADPALQSATSPAVKFSYLGQVEQALPADSPFALAKANPPGLAAPRGARGHLLEIQGAIHRGRLHVDWLYSANVHRPATVESLANDFLAALRALIAHCQSPEAGGYTPSDFALANVNQQQLDSLMAKFR